LHRRREMTAGTVPGETATAGPNIIRMGTTPRYITTQAAGQRLGVVAHTIRTWISQGRLRAQKVGRSWVVEESSVAELEQARRGGGS
jgi:excisionase family DNA binding protein